MNQLLKNENLADKIKQAMVEYFNGDQKRINHAVKVATIAQQIHEKEGGNLNIILTASYLHDIGIHEAEKKYNSTLPKYQQMEGPGVAKALLLTFELDGSFVDNICTMVGTHHTFKGVDSLEFQILYEADWIVNLEEDYKDKERVFKEKIIEKNFLTKTGKTIALTKI